MAAPKVLPTTALSLVIVLHVSICMTALSVCCMCCPGAECAPAPRLLAYVPFLLGREWPHWGPTRVKAG